MNKIISMEECELQGEKTVNNVFNNIVTKLNERHQSTNALSFFDQISIDLTQTDSILKESSPKVYKEILTIMREEYRALDELDQHCLFIYLSTNDKDEDEIVDSMIFHFEEWMEERAYSFLSSAKKDNKNMN